jgi:hypothetical protein
MLKEHLQPFSLHIQWHKNRSIWLKNEENIEKCSMLGMCLVMDGSTLVTSEQFSHFFDRCWFQFILEL